MLPENLKRLRKNKAIDVIKAGRIATQMPAFDKTLSSVQIQSLVDFVYTPLDTLPAWGEKEILKAISSIKMLEKSKDENIKPVYQADPLNLFLVVESGDHHVTVLDGDKMEPIYRFKSRFALHGGPKYSSDGRFVYFASRDGWISKFDMYTLDVVENSRWHQYP